MRRQKARICPPGATVALFVEGGDEERMCQRLHPEAAQWFVVPFHGRDGIADIVRATTNDPGWPGIRGVGVMIDAEDDPAASWAIVQLVFRTLGVVPPGAPGILATSGDWTVGGFLLPDNHAPGASETLLVRAASPQISACIDAFFRCTPHPGSTAAQRDESRAQLLAGASAPGGRPDALWAVADPSHEAFRVLRTFLAGLPSGAEGP